LCLQALDLGLAADEIRGMRIKEPPGGPGTAEATGARMPLAFLAEACRVGREDDEDFVYCQDLIDCACGVALGHVGPAVIVRRPEGRDFLGGIYVDGGRLTNRPWSSES
jgi:hypothetical protein